MAKRPTAKAKPEAWQKYATELEGENAQLSADLEAARKDLEAGESGEELRQLRRRIHALTGGRE